MSWSLVLPHISQSGWCVSMESHEVAEPSSLNGMLHSSVVVSAACSLMLVKFVGSVCLGYSLDIFFGKR